MFVFIHAVLI